MTKGFEKSRVEKQKEDEANLVKEMQNFEKSYGYGKEGDQSPKYQNIGMKLDTIRGPTSGGGAVAAAATSMDEVVQTAEEAALDEVKAAAYAKLTEEGDLVDSEDEPDSVEDKDKDGDNGEDEEPNPNFEFDDEFGDSGMADMNSFSKQVEKPPKVKDITNPLYMKPRFEASIEKGSIRDMKKPEEWIKKVDEKVDGMLPARGPQVTSEIQDNGVDGVLPVLSVKKSDEESQSSSPGDEPAETPEYAPK